MSYARKSYDSDVYVYQSTYGGIVCCGCTVCAESPVFHSRREVIDHLLAHRQSGHTVPQHALDRLAEEIAEFGDEV